MSDTATELLRRLGQEGGELPIAEAALAFSRLDHPDLDPAPYRRHLQALADDVAAAAPNEPGPDQQAAVLGMVLADRHGYRGDQETYDDLANADLMQVIDRRRGLPVALGILYLHAARAQGWRAAGMAFPGHFLIRLGDAEHPLVLDPFAGGAVCDADRLATLLRQTEPGNMLSPLHLRPAADREVLLRLQNNIKTRLIEIGAADQALPVIERMLLLAPRRGQLWYDAGLIHVRLGQLGAAIIAFEHAIAYAEDSVAAVDARELLGRVKAKLH